MRSYIVSGLARIYSSLVVRFPHGGFGTLVARQERFAKTNLEICEVLVDSDVTIKPDLIFNLRV
jgi:hypothetical protein